MPRPKPVTSLPPAKAPQAPPPGGSLAARCWETDTWTSADGTTRALGDMETSHLWNVLGYLRYHAEEVRRLTVLERQISVLSLRTWLAALPIWRAISLELARRGELADVTGALAKLEADSVVPWQEPSAKAA